MTKLFAQLYYRLIFSLFFVVAMSTALILSWAEHRFEQYVINHITPAALLAQQSWQPLPTASRSAWVDILYNLTDSQWVIVEQQQEELVSIIKKDWSNQTATVLIKLDETSAAQIDIVSWANWHVGHGWLLLNSISNVPADQRENLFRDLILQSPWPLARLNVNTVSLSALALRQLASGQSVRISESDGFDNYYFPAGASQVVRIGPVESFSFLSTQQWLLVVTLTLILLTVILAWLVRPIHKRIDAISQGVDRIYDDQSDIQLPSHYRDDFGLLARRIEAMANRLVLQIDQNRKLNQAVSHDFKTPLARMKFAVALAEHNPDKEKFARIGQEIDLLTDLTNELLLYHQINDTQANPNERISLQEILNSTLALYDSNDVKFSLNIENDIPAYSINEGHWRRVCQNLIDNAVQYGQGEVSISLTGNYHNARLSVTDNGAGMDQKEFEALKQPFSRAEKSRNLDRTNHGLGMSLVQAIADHYQGTFTLHNDTGTRLCMTLPFTAITM